MRIINSVEEKQRDGVGSNSKDKVSQNLRDQSVQRTRGDLM